MERLKAAIVRGNSSTWDDKRKGVDASLQVQFDWILCITGNGKHSEGQGAAL